MLTNYKPPLKGEGSGEKGSERERRGENGGRGKWRGEDGKGVEQRRGERGWKVRGEKGKEEGKGRGHGMCIIKFFLH